MFFRRRAGHKIIDRGDPSAVDFNKDDLTTDEAWHDLDLSAIIPSNAVDVLIQVDVHSNTANKFIMFRKKGNIYTKNVGRVFNVHSGSHNYNDVWVIPNTAGIVEYYASNVTWASINLVVRRWIIK